MTDFDDITASFEEDIYITVSTKELNLQIIPFFNLPARTIATLYSRKNNQEKFIKEIYKLIHVSMKNPEQFKEEVYETGVTYTGLIEFLNTWINISSLIQKFETGQIDADGNKTVKEVVSNVDIMQNIMFQKLAKGEEVKTKMFIRYLCEQVKQLAVQHNDNAVDSDDIIYEVNIRIPVNKEFDDEY